MSASCRGLCSRFESKQFGNIPKYANGFKRCSYCDVYMKTSDLRCPCYALKLRTKSRVNPKRRSNYNV